MEHKYRINTYAVPTDAVEVPAFREAFRQAWHELPLLQVLPLDTAEANAVRNLEGVEYFEVVARCNNTGRIGAYAAVTLEEDIHVGKCLSIAWCWVNPKANGANGFVRKLHQQVRQYATDLGVPYCYTKTVGYNVIVKYKVNCI